MNTYQHPRPAIAVDCILFGLSDGQLQVLLIRRGQSPFKDAWALPGGFVRLDETLDDAARRELLEETGVDCGFLEQLYTFGGLERDPRERVISVAYYALVNAEKMHLQARTDAVEAKWFSYRRIPKLAFDHKKILRVAIERLQGKVRYQPIGFELLPKKFTLTELQSLYEIVLQRTLDKRNFRKKVLNLNILVDLEERQTNVSHRAAKLYAFDIRHYRKMVKEGFLFEI